MFIKTVFPGNLGHQDVAFHEAVDVALEAGFSGYWFNPPVDFTLPEDEMLSLIQKKHILPMGMELPVDFRGDASKFFDELAKLEDIACYANHIGIRRAATWIVPFHETLSYAENFRLHVERLRLVLDVLARYSISLGLEFQAPRSLRKDRLHWFIHSLDGLSALIAAIDRENCGLVMDVWHWDLSGMTAFDFGQLAKDFKVIVVHVNDSPEGTTFDELMDLERRLPGATGVLDIDTFLDGLRNIGYSGPVIAEPFDENLASLSMFESFRVVNRSLDDVLSRLK